MRSRALVIVLLASLPLVLLVGWSLSTTVSRLSDPCFEWGVSHPARHISAASPCRSGGSSSDTKREVVVRSILVQGGILAASLLGILGAWFSKPSILVLASVLVFLESVPLVFSFGWLMIAVSGLFLLAARVGSSPAGHAANSAGSRAN